MAIAIRLVVLSLLAHLIVQTDGFLGGILARVYATDERPYCNYKNPNGVLEWDGATVKVDAPEGWTTDKVLLSVWDNEDIIMSEESCTEPLPLTPGEDAMWTIGNFTTSCSDKGQWINSEEVELYEHIEVHLKSDEGKDCTVTFNQCIKERAQGKNFLGGEFSEFEKCS